MTLLKTLFYKLGFSQERKPKVFYQVTMVLALCFLLEDVAFGEAGLVIHSWLG
jgi:hypothetical protein